MADLKYLHLLGFARVESKNGLTEVTLLNNEGESISEVPLVLEGDLPPNRVFVTKLKEANVKLINLLAEFDENQFETLKKAIPSLGNWENLPLSTGVADMNPIGRPPRQPQNPTPSVSANN